MKLEKSYKEVLNKIDTVILDVDGVLTDGTVTLMPDGSQIRKMHTKDGYAMQLAVKKGIKIFIISGGRDAMVRKRLEGLGINGVYLGVKDKVEKLEDLILMNDLKLDNIAYMGDDMPDYDPMKLVGLATCPKDSCADIRSISDYISPFEGGKGCVRDLLEQILKVKGLWQDNSNTKSI
jgi:3-deoxy-D-manno-octulosonate 8-phosphate phosphatase (KDO 8-P phosphatase)